MCRVLLTGKCTEMLQPKHHVPLLQHGFRDTESHWELQEVDEKHLQQAFSGIFDAGDDSWLSALFNIALAKELLEGAVGEGLSRTDSI